MPWIFRCPVSANSLTASTETTFHSCTSTSLTCFRIPSSFCHITGSLIPRIICCTSRWLPKNHIPHLRRATFGRSSSKLWKSMIYLKCAPVWLSGTYFVPHHCYSFCFWSDCPLPAQRRPIRPSNLSIYLEEIPHTAISPPRVWNVNLTQPYKCRIIYMFDWGKNLANAWKFL